MRTAAYDQFLGLLRARAFSQAAELAERENARRGGTDAFWLTQQAVALNAAGRAEEALPASDAALACHAGNSYALAARAEALARLGRLEQACADYEELAAGGPMGPRIRQAWFRCLAAAKAWSRLLAVLDQGNTPAGDGEWRVKALRGLGRDDEAIESCRRWLAAEKDLPAALWLLVDLEVAREGAEAVRERYARLARIPGCAQVYREIHASLCRRAGREDMAAAEYAAIAAGRPEGRIQRREAFALAKAGREREAIPLFEELLRENPRDPYVHSSYGAACRRAGELERAWKFYGDLLVLHPAEKALYGRRRRISRQLETPGP